MDFAKGLVKLSGHIKSKKQLEQKYINNPLDTIKEAIEKHKKDIAYYKKALDFDNVFDLGCEACSCDDDKNKLLRVSAELDEKDEKILKLTAEIDDLSKIVEQQNSKIVELESKKKKGKK